MDLFWRLILAHLLGDFTFQTNKIAKWKRESAWGVLFHCAIFFSTAVVLTMGRLSEVWVVIGKVTLPGWVCVAILTILHFLEDNWRVWTINKQDSPDSFGFFLWDQFIHYLMIFVFTPLDANIMPEKWVIIAIIYTIAMHFSTIFIYYIEKDIFGTAKIKSELKYYSIIERLAIVSLFLLPGNWWLFMIFIWIIKSVVYAIKKVYSFSWVHIIINYSTAIILGLAGKLVVNI